MNDREWLSRIDAYIEEENKKSGEILPVYRIYCQDNHNRSGGGFYNETVTIDTIGRFARALGDSNPLYSDPIYAKKTRWGGIIAPPLIESCIVSTFVKGKFPSVPGVKVFDAGTKWERLMTIRPNDTFRAENKYLGVEELPKNKNGDRILLRQHAITLINERNERAAVLTARTIIKCPSLETLRQSKSQTIQKPAESRPRYSKATLEKLYTNLDNQFDGRFRRGNASRYWEEVEIGDSLPEEWVGPYDESDGRSLMAAIGAANAFATKWGSLRKWRAHGLIDPETGAYRDPIDRHASDIIAQKQGSKRAIAYGIHSQALIAKAVSDWMGDDGVLKILDCQCRKILYYGDLSIQSGVVTEKYKEGKEYLVKIQMQAARQDGEIHTKAEAVVCLPSRNVA